MHPKACKMGGKHDLVSLCFGFLVFLCVPPYCDWFITDWASAILDYCRNLTVSLQTCGSFINLANQFSSITHVGLKVTCWGWGWRCFAFPTRTFSRFSHRKTFFTVTEFDSKLNCPQGGEIQIFPTSFVLKLIVLQARTDRIWRELVATGQFQKFLTWPEELIDLHYPLARKISHVHGKKQPGIRGQLTSNPAVQRWGAEQMKQFL